MVAFNDNAPSADCGEMTVMQSCVHNYHSQNTLRKFGCQATIQVAHDKGQGRDSLARVPLLTFVMNVKLSHIFKNFVQIVR
jgi:hypothetical protein